MEDTSRRDDWRSLCNMASHESDPQKLLELITRINRALEECHQRSRTSLALSRVDTVLPPIRSTSSNDFDFYSVPASNR